MYFGDFARSQDLLSSQRVVSSTQRSEPVTIRERAHPAISSIDFHGQIQAQKPASLNDSPKPSYFGEDVENRSKRARTMAEGTLDISQSLAAQQRKLISLTDKVLLKRTQQSHQRSTVETCRNFLNASLNELRAAIDSWLPERLAPPTARSSRRRKKRKKKAGNSDNTGITVAPPDVTSTDLGQTSIEGESTPQPHSHEPTVNETRLKTEHLFEQYRIDSEALIAAEANLSALTDDLSILEYELCNLLKVLRQQLRSIDFTASLHSALAQLDLEPTDSSQRASRAGTETPSLIAEYFDQRGDVGVYQERLQEVEYMYYEGLVERELIAERGDALDVSDAQFQETYELRRKKLHEEIRTAEEKAAMLADRCREENLDIDKYRRAGPSLRATSTLGQPNSVSDPHTTGGNLFEVAEQAESGSNAELPINTRSSGKVDTWLQDLNIEKGDQTAMDDWTNVDRDDADSEKL